MKAVGLITEYNPFHNGHRYHMQQARALTGADVVVVIMSGNYVQRGLPAILDKWQRTEAALHAGANLVLELPFAFAVQPAHLFAQGAMTILADLGVDEIVFGAEHPELDFLALAEQAALALTTSANFTGQYDQTYATQFNQVLTETVGQTIDQPNDLLGFAYANAVRQLPTDKQPRLRPIQRVQAGYHDQSLPESTTIASASAIRQALAQGDATRLAQFMPEAGATLLATTGSSTQAWDTTWFEAFKAKVLTTPALELEKLYQLQDGLGFRMRHLIEAEPAIEAAAFLEQFKSKRYTYARLQRAMLYTVLGITADAMATALAKPYLRVLGTDPSGRQYLKQQRKQLTLPVVNRVTKAVIADNLTLDYQVGKMYQLFGQTLAIRQAPQDAGRPPLFMERNDDK